jgi:hypothetical protein
MSRRYVRVPRISRTFPRQLWFVALCAVVVPAVLLVSGLRTHTTRVYAYSVPTITPLTTLTPGKQICEGPLIPQGAFQTAVFINSGANARALITVHTGRTATAPAVALGLLETVTPAEAENAVLLTQPVSTTSPLTLCVREQRGSMTLYGGSPWSGAPVIAGTSPATTLWLQLLSAVPHRFFGSLRLAFRRASLFRPGWVGTWTFWGLLLLIFAGFPAIVVGIRFALQDDAGSSGDDRDGS